MTEAKRQPRRPGVEPNPPASSLLGVAWAGVVIVALLSGSVTLGLWLGCAAGLAALQAARTWRREKRPQPIAAAAGAALAVVGAAFGITGFAVAAVLGLAGAAAWASADGAQPAITVLCALIPVAAATPAVLLRATDGLVPALVLLVDSFVYDAATFVMGAGAKRRWVGPAVGMCFIGSVTLLVAAVFPQFHGLSAWELGVVAAVLTPLGPFVANLALGNNHARVPALRRIDSLLLVGPAWAIAAAVLVS